MPAIAGFYIGRGDWIQFFRLEASTFLAEPLPQLLNDQVCTLQTVTVITCFSFLFLCQGESESCVGNGSMCMHVISFPRCVVIIHYLPQAEV